jgi:hypothetical protein
MSETFLRLTLTYFVDRLPHPATTKMTLIRRALSQLEVGYTGTLGELYLFDSFELKKISAHATFSGAGIGALYERSLVPAGAGTCTWLKRSVGGGLQRKPTTSDAAKCTSVLDYRCQTQSKYIPVQPLPLVMEKLIGKLDMDNLFCSTL